jgi:UDP-N-acetylglucosamine--N-acetylmuramyl-(pentapeptide) pyrophosphoryl-undecaprenol N-acetylglucosamine transferase
LSANAAPPLVVVVAGGTGGHLFPAEALSVALAQRGVIVDLATDERATRYGSSFPARETHVVPSATLRKSDPVTYVTAPLAILEGAWQSYRLLRALRPAAVIGFGGYPTVPPLIAAGCLHIPTLIHEQNGVLGRANRRLARDLD